MLTFSCLIDSACMLAEGPVWDERRGLLFFVDILKPAIHAVRLDGGGHRTWPMPEVVGSIGLTESGRLVAALRHDVVLFDPDTTTISPLAHVPGEPPTNRLNDGKVGPDGAFWVGSMDDRAEREPIAALYRVTADGKVERKVTGLMISNGLAFTADGRTMFHSDAPALWIDTWRFDPATGAISDRKRFATLDFANGVPDGAACDVDGYYWSAGNFGARVNRFAPDGTLVAAHTVPVPTPTMTCFCGPDLKTLAVTSMRFELPAEAIAANPLIGGVFVAKTNVAGVPVGRMRGV